jgi:hypothetical protein
MGTEGLKPSLGRDLAWRGRAARRVPVRRVAVARRWVREDAVDLDVLLLLLLLVVVVLVVVEREVDDEDDEELRLRLKRVTRAWMKKMRVPEMVRTKRRWISFPRPCTVKAIARSGRCRLDSSDPF